jgi:hypothetical protein
VEILRIERRKVCIACKGKVGKRRGNVVRREMKEKETTVGVD